MEKKNNNGVVIMLMGVIIVILAVLCVLFATGTININGIGSSDDTSNNVKDTSINEETSENDITQEEILKIVDDELFIFFMWKEPNRKISDLDNQSKLYVALKKIYNDYTKMYDNINFEIRSFSTKDLEKAFNETCLSELSIVHESLDNFEYDSSNGMYNNNNLMSKMYLNYIYPDAKKVVSYSNDNDVYKISIKYLFPDGHENAQNYYGDNEQKNFIVGAYFDGTSRIDAQKYLDENFEIIKDKLATYNYTFKYENNKLVLTDFSIN